MIDEINIPTVPASRITEDVLRKVEALSSSITSSDIATAEREAAARAHISVGTLQRYKSELRGLFKLPPRANLSLLKDQPSLRQVCEYVVVRAERSDHCTLRSAKNLSVLITSTGETLSVEAFLKSLYPREGVNASSCYRALRARCMKKEVLCSDGSACTVENLPHEASVIRFLKNWREEYVAVRRGRSRKSDWEKTQEAFITRDVSAYEPGELWIGDHTELDFMVLNERGKLDRRWITAFTDIRTGLIVGYNLNWQPSSETIALAFRAAILGHQLMAYTGERYEKLSISNVPKEVMMDNGKDYRSAYTQRVFGRIDFDDSARRSVMRITKLHYVLPYHGQSKAQMERWFRTIQTMLKYLPGFKANTYQNKPDSLKSDLKSGNVLNVQEFDLIVQKAINVYNNRVHRTLKDQSPIQAYLTNMSCQRTIDLRVLDFLMMRVESKPVRRCQLTLFGNEYYSDALMSFNGKRADLYYDPTDLGFVSIYVEGEFAALACNKQMIGQDEKSWQRILADRKRGERVMQDDLKLHRAGITNEMARTLLQEGELSNVVPVARELLTKNVSTLTLLTGLEQDAKKVDEEIKQQAEFVEIERLAKKRAKRSQLTYQNVINNIS